MKITINQIIEMYKGEYADIEFYLSNSNGRHFPNHFHTDNCEWLEDFQVEQLDFEEEQNLIWQLMDKEEYNCSILTNDSTDIDDVWGVYDNEKKLLIMIERKGN